jgi:hypothetical protein
MSDAASTWKADFPAATGQQAKVTARTHLQSIDALLVPLYLPTAWYSRLKARRRDIAWLKYL